MNPELDHFYLRQTEPTKSCLIALRDIVLLQNEGVKEAWKYKMPFFTYKGSMFCYLWVHKNKRLPYLGFVDGKMLHHPDLVSENRARMKILLVDPEKDLPLATLQSLLAEALALYGTKSLRSH